MTEFTVPSPLTQELNDAHAILKGKHADKEKPDDLNGNLSELKQHLNVSDNHDPRKRTSEQTDSLDLPHMDTPSPVSSPLIPSAHNLAPSFAIPNVISSTSHSTIPNGLPTPPLSPSSANLQNLPPLSPIIPTQYIPAPTPALTPTPTSTNTNIPSTAPTPNHTENQKPSPRITPLPTAITPLPSHPSFTSAPPSNSASSPFISSSHAPQTPNHATPTKSPAPPSSSASTPGSMHTQLQLEKAQKDLARLRQHLMEMEEQHTLETESMAEKIAQLESATQQSEKKRSSQDSTIQKLTETNDRLTSTLRERELDLDTTSAALYNLQNVLAQFQAQREEDIKTETQTLRNEAARANQQVVALQKERDALLEKVKKIGELETHTRTLQHELTAKTRTILAMQEEVEPLRRALNQSAERLSQMAKNEQNLVEKTVVTKLIVTYLSQGKKQDVLSLMARILNFTEEEMQKVGLISGKGWIPFLRSSSSSVPSTPRGGERSVGDLWMEFLLKEVGEAQQQEKDAQTEGKVVVP